MYRLCSSSLVLFLSFLLIFAPFASNAEAAKTGIMTLSKLNGDVKVLRGGAPVGNPQPGLELAANDEIVTGADSTADVKFPSEEVIRIMGNSRVKLNQGDPNQISVGLTRGKIFNVISKYTDKVTTYKVVTPTATAGVRGTIFSSDVADDETSVFMVKAGKVGAASTTVVGDEVVVDDLKKTIVKKGKLPTVPVALTAAEIATFAIIADLVSAGMSTGAMLAIAGGIAAVGGVAALAGGGGGSSSDGGGIPAVNSWSSWTVPTDPAPGQSVTVYVSVGISGVSVNYTVNGTDGYQAQGTLTSNSSGEINFVIPGGALGVVDTVTVSVPSWGSQYTKTWTYTF